MRIRLGICASLAVVIVACGSGSQQSFQAEVRSARAAGTSIAWYERGQGPPW